MFKTLAPYAQHSIVEVKLIVEGGLLRAHINRRPNEENDEKVISLSLLNTPERLDAELALALAEHFLETEAPKSVAEQVKEQIDAGSKEEAPAAPAKAKAKKAAATPRKVKARALKVKPEKPANAEKPVPAPKARKGRKRRPDSELPTVAQMRGILADPQNEAQAETKPPQGETPAPVQETNPAARETGHVGAALPDGEAREAVSTGAPVTGDRTGQALPAIPASSRDASTLDLF